MVLFPVSDILYLEAATERCFLTSSPSWCKIAVSLTSLWYIRLCHHLYKRRFYQTVFKLYENGILHQEECNIFCQGFPKWFRCFQLKSLMKTTRVCRRVDSDLTLSRQSFLSYKNQSTDLQINQWTGFYMIETSIIKELLNVFRLLLTSGHPILAKVFKFLNLIFVALPTNIISRRSSLTLERFWKKMRSIKQNDWLLHLKTLHVSRGDWKI